LQGSQIDLTRRIRSHPTHKFHVRWCSSRPRQVTQPQSCIPGHTRIHACIADTGPLVQFQLAFYRRKGSSLPVSSDSLGLSPRRHSCRAPLITRETLVDDLPNSGRPHKPAKARCRSVLKNRRRYSSVTTPFLISHTAQPISGSQRDPTRARKHWHRLLSQH
jgi:hypothetical protein